MASSSGNADANPRVRIDMTGFRPATFETGKVHMQGGLLRTSIAMVTKKHGLGNKGRIFVKISTTEPWLIRATMGENKAETGAFGRTSLIEMLRVLVEQASLGELEEQIAEASAVAGEGDEVDPMAAVDTGGGVRVSPLIQGAKRRRFSHNPAKNQVVTVKMQAECPEVDTDAAETRPINLFVVDRKQIWLSIDDVDWAIRWLYMQNLLKGVPLVPPNSQGPCGPAAIPVNRTLNALLSPGEYRENSFLTPTKSESASGTLADSASAVSE